MPPQKKRRTKEESDDDAYMGGATADAEEDAEGVGMDDDDRSTDSDGSDENPESVSGEGSGAEDDDDPHAMMDDEDKEKSDSDEEETPRNSDADYSDEETRAAKEDDDQVVAGGGKPFENDDLENALNSEVLNFEHPELILQNREEIQKLCITMRDAYGEICDPYHTFQPFMTKYERSKIISMRAVHIENNSPPHIILPEGMINPVEIAILELKAHKIPFIIKRTAGKRTEFWPLHELEMCIGE